MSPAPRTHRRTVRGATLAVIGATVAAVLSACAGTSQAAPEPRVPVPASTEGLTRSDVDTWLDGMLPDALAEGRIAGATVAVISPSEGGATVGSAAGDCPSTEPRSSCTPPPRRASSAVIA